MRSPDRPFAVTLTLLTLPLLAFACFREEAPLPTVRAPPDAGPADAPPDARAELTVRAVRVLDARGVEHALEIAPRRPTVVIEIAGSPGGDPEPALLFHGEPDADLADDLEALPLRESTLSRAVVADVGRTPSEIRIVPREMLAPGTRYTVALGAWAQDAAGTRVPGATVVELRVSGDPAAGAAALESWPPDGTAGVPPSLPLAAIRFDGHVERIAEGIELVREDGARVEVSVRLASCAEIGWAGGTCVAIEPRAALAPSTRHELRARPPLCDALGAPLDPWSAAFTTAADEDLADPGWLDPVCALDERATGAGCVLADDGSVAIRVRATEPVRLALESAAGHALAVAPRGEATLRLAGLVPELRLPAVLRATDLAGRETTVMLALATTAPLAPLAITEIRADPRGPEPRQEYVEVLNSATVPWDLDGFAIADRADAPGDPIVRPPPIPAGARALIVADAFDPEDPADERVPPGVVLIRIGTSIAGGGLSNSGEALYLRDAAGRRVSAAPAAPARPGVCLVRVAADGRDGSLAAFAFDEAGGCTPGSAGSRP